jgi:hypothetical protein
MRAGVRQVFHVDTAAHLSSNAQRRQLTGSSIGLVGDIGDVSDFRSPLNLSLFSLSFSWAINTEARARVDRDQKSHTSPTSPFIAAFLPRGGETVARREVVPRIHGLSAVVNAP